MVRIEGLVTDRGRGRELKGCVTVTTGLFSVFLSPMGLTVSIGSILPTQEQSLYGVSEEMIGR